MRKGALLSRLRFRRAALAAGRRRRGRARYGGKRTQLKGFTALQSRSILGAIGRSDETKYTATQLCVNQLLDAAIHTPGQDILPLVPPIRQGVAENQRVGRKVAPTKCRVDITASFAQQSVGSALAIESTYADAIYVVMYIVRSKTHHNWSEWQATNATPATAEWNYLLDDGQGNSVPFGVLVPGGGTNPSYWTANNQFLQYPIETTHYTLVKKRIVKLVRNQGQVRTGVSGEAPNLPQSFYKGSFTYKLPKLVYDDTPSNPSGGYPTNSNLMLMVGYTFCDNLNYEDLVPDGSVAPPAMLSITARNHVWFKDA